MRRFQERIRRGCVAALGIGALFALAGCFSEQSFPMVPGRLVWLAPADVIQHQGGDQPQRISTREWAARIHALAAGKLPVDDQGALLTDGLATAQPAGVGITNVWHHFGLDPARLDSLWWNLRGIEETAQVTSPPPAAETGVFKRDDWPAFHDIDVPASDGAILCGRYAEPDPANAIPGSFIILTHGLFGSMVGADALNHAEALRRAGHHVLALEMRGHGETTIRHPEYSMTFGIRESGDLLAAARWLKETKGATRVGLVTFSLTGYESMLTAWLDGNRSVTEFTGDQLLAPLPQAGAEPAFNGGMFVVSSVVGATGVTASFEKRVGLLEAPVKATFQSHVEARLAEFKEAGYSIEDLVRCELLRSGLVKGLPDLVKLKAEMMSFTDLSAQDWQEGARRMEQVRVPMVILSAANDPLATAQGVAELFGRVRNPNIAVIMLREGGHMGFAALSADYYYSVMLNFFDPRTAPGIVK